MEKVYIIKTNHGYEFLLKLGLTKRAFKTRERCDEIISKLAEDNYGKPMYSENSRYVKLVKRYWAGDFSKEEAIEQFGEKVDIGAVFNSALYYDFKRMFWIEEYELED